MRTHSDGGNSTGTMRECALKTPSSRAVQDARFAVVASDDHQLAAEEACDLKTDVFDDGVVITFDELRRRKVEDIDPCLQIGDRQSVASFDSPATRSLRSERSGL